MLLIDRCARRRIASASARLSSGAKVSVTITTLEGSAASYWLRECHNASQKIQQLYQIVEQEKITEQKIERKEIRPQGFQKRGAGNESL